MKIHFPLYECTEHGLVWLIRACKKNVESKPDERAFWQALEDIAVLSWNIKHVEIQSDDPSAFEVDLIECLPEYENRRNAATDLQWMETFFTEIDLLARNFLLIVRHEVETVLQRRGEWERHQNYQRILCDLKAGRK